MEHVGLRERAAREAAGGLLVARLRGALQEIRQGSARGHGARHLITWAIALSLVVACAGAPAGGAREPPTADDTAFALYGSSWHAWARRGASEAEFKKDARACLDASAASRRGASPEQEPDIAYHTFQDCMRARGWTTPAPGAELRHLRPHETRVPSN